MTEEHELFQASSVMSDMRVRLCRRDSEKEVRGFFFSLYTRVHTFFYTSCKHVYVSVNFRHKNGPCCQVQEKKRAMR